MIKMRIVFTSFTYAPKRDGVQNVTQYQAEGLVKLGHEVCVITSDWHQYSKTDIINGVRVVRLPAYKYGLWVCGNKKETQRIALEEIQQADVLICVCVFSFLDQWILPMFKDIKCRKIGIMHGMHEFGYSKSDFESLRLLLKKTIQNVRWYYFFRHNWEDIKTYNAMIHLHEKDYSYKYFVSHNYLNNFIIYNAVDDRFFLENEKCNRVINVGTFHSNKNQRKCLEVFYHSDLNDYVLTLVGPEKNAYYNQLLSLKEELDDKFGKRNVEFLCGITREETIELIKSSKIYLLTSDHEHFPISLIEAMATGSAFVATDVGVVSSFPGGVVASDFTGLVSELNKMKKNWSRFGEQGSLFARKSFVRNIQVLKLNNIIKDICSDEYNY